MLIEALPAVAERVPDVTLDVVGSPRMPIEPLRERAEALGVAGRISWDLRFVPESEVAAVVATGARGRPPLPLDRGLGRARHRARQGVPPVVTAVGTFPELCAEYDLGDPVPPDDPAAFAGALVRSADRSRARERAPSRAWRARAPS